MAKDGLFEAATAAGSFQFDSAARNALERLLHSPQLVTDLEATVAWHRYAAFWRPVRPDRPLGEVERRDLRALQRALKRLTEILGRTDSATLWNLAQDFEGGVLSRVHERRTLADLSRSPELPYGMALKEWANSTRGVELLVRWLLRPQPPGRKLESARLALCVKVRDLLDKHGIPIARSRDGVFARTLNHVLDAAGERTPEDSFYLVKQAIDGAPPSRRPRKRRSLTKRGRKRAP